MKYKFVVFLTLLFLFTSSCMNSSIKEDIQKELDKAKFKIEQAGDKQVESIIKQLNEKLISASNDISLNVKEASKGIKETANKEAQAIEKTLVSYQKNITISRLVGVCGLILSVLCLGLSVLSLLKLRRETLKDTVVQYVLSSKRIEDFVDSVIRNNSSTIKINIKQDEFINLFNKYILEDSKIREKLFKELSESQSESFMEVASNNQSESLLGQIEDSSSKALILYAQDTTTNVLSHIYNTHTPGFTIYKLIMNSSHDDTAEIDLSLEHEDVVARVLKFNKENLESICIVNRDSLSPSSITVLRKGKAKKNVKGEWEVVEKLELNMR